MLIVDKKNLNMKRYGTFAINNTHHASLRCTLWWVFDFYTLNKTPYCYAV